MLSFILAHSYLAVFFLVLPEGFGVPLPGETALITAAAFAARGQFKISFVIIAAALGAVVGDQTGYWIGRRGGPALVARLGKTFRMPTRGLERARVYFDRHGAATVFFGRYVALLRILAPMLAGLSGMSYPRFALANLAGGVAWASTFGAIGYAFGYNLPLLERVLGRAGLAMALLGTVATSLVIAWQLHSDDSRPLRARLALPDERVTHTPVAARIERRMPRAWAWGARYSPRAYLGVHLAAGMLASLAVLGLFATVTENVLEGDTLLPFDLTVAADLHRETGTGLQHALDIASRLGDARLIFALAVVVALALLVRHRRTLALAWIAALAGGRLIETVLHLMIRRPSPVGDHAIAENLWYLPSGHALGSLIAYGMLGYLLVLATHRRTLRLTILAISTILIAAIGLSRLALGTHYFSDLAAGWAAGAVWLAACVSGADVVRKRVVMRRL